MGSGGGNDGGAAVALLTLLADGACPLSAAASSATLDSLTACFELEGENARKSRDPDWKMLFELGRATEAEEDVSLGFMGLDFVFDELLETRSPSDRIFDTG